MEKIDNNDAWARADADEEEMFLSHVIQGDHELLYLDTYLRELFGNKG